MLKTVTKEETIRVCDYCDKEEDSLNGYLIQECLICRNECCPECGCNIQTVITNKRQKYTNIQGNICKAHIGFPEEFFNEAKY